MSRSYVSKERAGRSSSTARDLRMAFTTEQRHLALKLADALDPAKAPSKPKTFSQMSETERETMRRLYEKKP